MLKIAPPPPEKKEKCFYLNQNMQTESDDKMSHKCIYAFIKSVN